MKKRIWAAIVTAVCIIGASLTVQAAENGNKFITFKGEAEKFVTQSSGSLEEGFIGMQPGESRELTITLRNDDYSEMKFYMSADILENLADKGNQESVYILDISKEEEIFFETIIGNEENAAGKEYLDENNNILLGTLAQGEETTVTIAITLDGDSTGNAYMNEEGAIRLVFSVASPEEKETIIKTVKKYITGETGGKKTDGTSTAGAGKVKTGDSFPVWLLGAAGISLVVILIILFRRRSKK